MKEGHIFTDGEIGPDYHIELKAQLAKLPADTQKIIHHISSPGGSVYGGYKGYHALRLAGVPIKSVIEGECQSIATFVALAGDEVEILHPSIWMIHLPSMGIQGNASDFDSAADELRTIEEEMAQAYSIKTKMPIDRIKEMMKVETRMNATQAKNSGFVDKVTNQLRAVALGKPMEKTTKNLIQQLGEKISALGTPAVAAPPQPKPVPPAPAAPPAPPKKPAAIDIPLQDNSVLTVDAPSPDQLMNAPATYNGAPALDQIYIAQDGTEITCAGGVVVAVEPADVAAMNKANQALADAQAKLAELQASKAKAEADALAATALLTTQATALADIQKDFDVLKTKTLGDDAPPAPAMIANKGFNITGKLAPSALGINLTQRFLAENFGWLEEHYKMRGMKTDFFREYGSQPQMTSIVETNFNFTYPGILTTDLLYKPSIDTPAISDMFTIDQNIKFQKQYNLVAVLNQILKPYGGCAATSGNSNSDRDRITNTTLITKEFRMEEAWCKDDFTSQLTGVYNNLAQEWLKTGEASFDPAGTPIDQVIQEVLTDALRRDVFGRYTMAAGNSSNANFNQIDGLWDRLIDSSGSQINYCVVRGGSSLGVGTITAANAVAALENVYAAAPTILKQMMSKATFWVTGSVYDAYINQLIGQGNVSQAQFENTIMGVQGNKTWDGGVPYKGIMVRPVRYWDSSLTDANNPLFATTRHLILLTVKQNHVAGVENGGDLNKIYSWYENKDSKRYYRSDMKLGYQYMHCDLQAIAY